MVSFWIFGLEPSLAHLHYGKNRCELVHFKEQKNTFCILNGHSLEQFSP